MYSIVLLAATATGPVTATSDPLPAVGDWVVLDGLKENGLGDVPVVVGGIIPDADAETLRSLGVAAVFTPKDYDATAIMARVLDEVRAARGLPRLVGVSA